MKATVKLLGYSGIVKVIEETETGYEIEMLEGILAGKRTFISKESKAESIFLNHERFTSLVEYKVGKEYNEETKTEQVYCRYFDLTITAKDKETTERIWDDCYAYLKKHASFNPYFVGCPAYDPTINGKYYYYDSLAISDKSEFDELKKLYMEWKRLYK